MSQVDTQYRGILPHLHSAVTDGILSAACTTYVVMLKVKTLYGQFVVVKVAFIIGLGSPAASHVAI